ncbi:MAG: hypothetical protein ACYCU7_18305 [Acidimicrobiales bacterium]
MAGKKPTTRENKRPWRMVRRDSAWTKDLVALLDKEKVTIRGEKITGRRIEDLSKDGLLAPDDATPEHVVAHFGELDKLGYGPGKSAHDTALRLLCRGARGFGTERARAILLARTEALLAVLTRIESGERPVEALDLSSEASAWIGRGSLERIRAAFEDVPIGGRLTYSGRLLRETPDGRAVGAMQSMVDMASGRPPTDADLTFDIASRLVKNSSHDERVGLPDDLDMVETIGRQFVQAVRMAPTLVARVSLHTLAAAAAVAYDLLAGSGLTDADRELAAATRAPYDLGMMAAGFAPLTSAIRAESLPDGRIGGPAAD